MTIEVAESIGSVIGVFESLEEAIWFGSHFLWIVIYYILFQIFRYPFLKFLIAAEVMGVIYWFWSHLFYFTGVPENQNYSLAQITVIGITETLLRTAPLILGTIAGICALKKLQMKVKEMKANNRAIDAHD